MYCTFTASNWNYTLVTWPLAHYSLLVLLPVLLTCRYKSYYLISLISTSSFHLAAHQGKHEFFGWHASTQPMTLFERRWNSPFKSSGMSFSLTAHAHIVLTCATQSLAYEEVQNDAFCTSVICVIWIAGIISSRTLDLIFVICMRLAPTHLLW